MPRRKPLPSLSSSLSSSSSSSPSRLDSTRLLLWEDVPDWLQFNKFVRTGYRPPMTRAQALLSIFSWHNETMNIWTHLLPLFYFLYVFINELLTGATIHEHHWPQYSASSSQKVYPSSDPQPFRFLYLFAAAGCVFVCAVSTAYHSMMCSCTSQGEYKRLICVDILGSVVVISATAIPLLLFGNPCFSTWTKTWMLSLFGVSTAATTAAIFSQFMTVGQRFLLFGVHLLLRLGLQFATLMPKYRATGTHGSMTLHSHSFICLLVGGVVNVARVPERFFTRSTTTTTSAATTKTTVAVVRRSPEWLARMFDFIGNSHNIWHVLSIYSCYLTFCGVAVDYLEFDEHPFEKADCKRWA